jgi:hypothetical protein
MDIRPPLRFRFSLFFIGIGCVMALEDRRFPDTILMPVKIFLILGLFGLAIINRDELRQTSNRRQDTIVDEAPDFSFFISFLKEQWCLALLPIFTGCLSICINGNVFTSILSWLGSEGFLFAAHQGKINGVFHSNTGECKRGTFGYNLSLVGMYLAYFIFMAIPLVYKK